MSLVRLDACGEEEPDRVIEMNLTSDMSVGGVFDIIQTKNEAFQEVEFGINIDRCQFYYVFNNMNKLTNR
jgi:hypothetical protein